MKIYTGTGDKGETGLIGGSRTKKASLRIQSIGDVDELNASIGVARTNETPRELADTLGWIQAALFEVGAELASVPGGKRAQATIDEEASKRLERSIDEMEVSLAPLKSFILPGGCRLAADLHLARGVCRRAERSVLALHEKEPQRTELLVFLNRLSDWLFVAARTANRSASIADVPWLPS